MPKIKCYGWDSVKLYRNLSMSELTALQQQVQVDPKSRNPAHATGSIYLYTKAARRKLDAISWAMTYHLQDARKNSAS